MRGDKLKGALLYYLFKSVRELGVDLNLLFRRFAVSASSDIDSISKEFFGGKIDTSNFEQMIEDLSNVMKNEGIVEDIKITKNEDHVTLEVSNCSFLPMAEKAIQNGEKTCPLCLISLVVAIPATISKGYELNLAENEVDIENKRCVLKISHKV